MSECVDQPRDPGQAVALHAATGARIDEGPLTARQRIHLLLDESSFHETHRTRDGGVVTGWGTVRGRKVFVYAYDARGSSDRADTTRIHWLADRALDAHAPLVALDDGSATRLLDAAGCGAVVRGQVQASGVIPQVSVLFGPCAGGAAYSHALADFVFAVRSPADPHGTALDIAHFVHDDDRSCLDDVRYLLALLPYSRRESRTPRAQLDPIDRETDELLDIVPTNAAEPYDMWRVIEEIVDDRDYLEFGARPGESVVCALARLGGAPVGLVAHRPRPPGRTAIDGTSVEVIGVDDTGRDDTGPDDTGVATAARFVRSCDAFDIPLVTIVDRHRDDDDPALGDVLDGAALLRAHCAATVPKVAVVMRDTGARAAFPAVGADVTLAWSTSRDAGLADDVIDPAETRRVVIGCLDMLRGEHTEVHLQTCRHGRPVVTGL
jgi:acetyl-CoA carboxylase carboxyltransferase component